MDIVVSPTTVAFNTQLGSPLPAFQVGEVLDALVLQLLDSGVVRLSIGDTVVDVKTQVPLVPGATVRLAVRNSPDGVRLVLIDPAASPAPGSARSDPSAGSNARPASAPENEPPTSPTTGDTIAASAPRSPPNAPATSAEPAPAVVLAQTVRAAAVRQGGLAPLFADLAVVAAGPANSPASTATAAAIARAPRPPVSPGAVAPVGGAATVSAATAGRLPTAASPATARAVPAATTSLVPTALAAVPEPVRQAAARLLALRLPVDGEISADDVKQAFVRSGLLFEARLAAQTASAPATAGAPAALPADDLKAALVVFKQLLETWLAAEPASLSTAADKPLLGLPNMKPAPSIVPGNPSSGPAGEAPSAPASVAAPASGPPPPYRGAPPAAQPAVASMIAGEATPRDMAVRLAADTDAALARQTMLQAASLPDPSAAQPPHGDPSGPRWNFEVPFAAPQGTAIAQFEISRDGRASPAEGIKPVWRARFTLDVEPMGAVHAQVALPGERTMVTLWAERAGSAARLRENSAMLTDALKQAELEPGDVLVRDGAPPRPREAASAGRFVDRAS